MKGITPNLWYDTEAVEAAEFYASAIPGSKVTNVVVIPGTPSGDTDVVSFELAGQPFMAISAGPVFSFNPSVSFMVQCETASEVDAIWGVLSEGGKALMPLDAYPFSERFGWTEDRYGLSWQVGLLPGSGTGQRIVPALLFTGPVCGRAREAVDFYTSVFPGSGLDVVDEYGTGEDPETEGSVRFAGFRLSGQEFAAMDSARDHDFAFNEAVSLMVVCEDQAEIDRYWDALSAVPEAEQCGWLKDRFGVSWQIVPAAMDAMMAAGTPEQIARVTGAFLPMKKFDLAALRAAYEG